MVSIKAIRRMKVTKQLIKNVGNFFHLINVVMIAINAIIKTTINLINHSILYSVNPLY
ncbi:MAG: hypothetical protein MJ200_02270 [Mycoplasmoidaceae bacterium]|nr:hypothetical protein [Mycoplasmoidaceae bacterium]